MAGSSWRVMRTSWRLRWLECAHVQAGLWGRGAVEPAWLPSNAARVFFWCTLTEAVHQQAQAVRLGALT